jgi:hypothetical protein
MVHVSIGSRAANPKLGSLACFVGGAFDDSIA